MHYEHTYNAVYVVVVRVMVNYHFYINISKVRLALLVTMIIEHYRCIITHYRYVHNALLTDALSKVLPTIFLKC